MRTSRLEAFSDGVLAIIITIMVLELHDPTPGKTLGDLWNAAGIGLLSYLLSFVYVGIYWANHHHMFQLTTRVTGGVLWANLGLLFCLSLFPFTTQWVDGTGWARTPVVVYGVNLLVAAVAYYILQSVIIRTQGKDSPLRNAIGRDLKGKVSPAFYIAGMVAALTGGGGSGAARPGIWIAVACYVAVAAMWVIPDRRIESVIAAAPLGPAQPAQPAEPPEPAEAAEHDA
jgi:TMEM175 potassium channel family protein